MKKLLFLSSIVVLLVAMKKPETTRPLTFEQAMTHAYNAQNALFAIEADTADATWVDALDVFITKMEYVESNWNIQAELDARPCCGTLCTAIGLVSFWTCIKRERRDLTGEWYCTKQANATMSSCNSMWPWLPKPKP